MLNSETQDWKGQKSWLKIWSGSKSKDIPFQNLLLLVLHTRSILRNCRRRILKHLSAISTIYILPTQLVVEWLGKRYWNYNVLWIIRFFPDYCECLFLLLSRLCLTWQQFCKIHSVSVGNWKFLACSDFSFWYNLLVCLACWQQ